MLRRQPGNALTQMSHATGSSQSALASSSLSKRTRLLLACDAIGWMLFTITFLIEGATRPGYIAWRQAISALSLGPYGWVQRLNFGILGALLIVSALGWQQALAPGTGSRIYSSLRAITGLSLIVAGIFSQDPAPGYPPGATQTAPTLSGDIHQLCAFVSVTALALSCFVLARRFAIEPEWRSWTLFAVIAGYSFSSLSRCLAH